MSRPTTAMPAVVLATRPLGEADLLVVLLTPEHGKVRAAARSARKSKRRFAGGLTGGAVGNATLAVRPRSLWRLDGFVPLSDHSAVGRDLTRFAYVAYLCELTDVLVVEPEPDPQLFVALTGALGRTIGDTPDPAVLRWYELALLGSLGLLPAWRDCAVCGQPVLSAPGRDTVRFDVRRGGVLCSVHGAGAGAGRGESERTTLYSAATVAMAAELTGSPAPPRWIGADADPPSAAVRRGLRDLLRDILRPHVRRPLRSLEFFAQLPPAPPSAPKSGD